MAAGMKQDDVAGWNLLQRGEHRGKIESLSRSINVGIGLHLLAGGSEDGGVIGPGRFAHPDFGRGKVLPKEVRRHP